MATPRAIIYPGVMDGPDYNPDIGPDECGRIAELLAVPIYSHRDWPLLTHRTLSAKDGGWFVSFGQELTYCGPFSDAAVQQMVAAGALVPEPGTASHRLAGLPSDSVMGVEGSFPSQQAPSVIVADYLARTPGGTRALNLGCGGATIDGFLNIDAAYPWHVGILWDLNQGLPGLPDGAFDAIYTEAFWEHVSRPAGARILGDGFKALRAGGTVRIATPDLDDLIRRYLGGTTMPAEGAEAFTEAFGPLTHTRGEWFNIGMRAWGHTYIYNLEDITDQLTSLGFVDVKRCELGRSSVPLLDGRETRPFVESSLIVEATRP